MLASRTIATKCRDEFILCFFFCFILLHKINKFVVGINADLLLGAAALKGVC